MSAAGFLTMMFCAAVAGSAAPAAFEFQDTAKYEDRQVVQYRAIEFRDTPVRPLGDERKFEAAQYGLVPVGPKPETALTIVWLPKAPNGPELWLDANGDGRLTDDERHAMSGRELEIPATIVVLSGEEPKKVQRRLVFRRSSVGEGMRYTVRGYMKGTLNLSGKECATLLIDGNANGCFDNVGQDRVWVDLNQDGRFDPLSEQFPLGKPITLGQDVYVVRSDATASAVAANLRSAGQGKIRLALANKSAAAAKISAELVSDLGELVCIDKLDEPTPVPFGEYRISSMKLQVPDASGQTWTYNFYCERTKNYSVPVNGDVTVSLLKEITMDVSLQLEKGRASPGQTVAIQPKLLADQSYCLSACTIGDENNPRRAEGNAEVVLLGADGQVVSRGMTGFS